MSWGGSVPILMGKSLLWMWAVPTLWGCPVIAVVQDLERGNSFVRYHRFRFLSGTVYINTRALFNLKSEYLHYPRNFSLNFNTNIKMHKTNNIKTELFVWHYTTWKLNPQKFFLLLCLYGYEKPCGNTEKMDHFVLQVNFIFVLVLQTEFTCSFLKLLFSLSKAAKASCFNVLKS